MNSTLLQASRRIHRIFREEGITLSSAESCTGGMIASCLTAIPGASGFFLAGAVAYAASSKRALLGIEPSKMKRHGLVSPAIAKEMARRFRLISSSDYAVSTTGNLGPDVLEGKARGLVYIAVSSATRTVVEEHCYRGSRGQVRAKAVAAALRLVAREALKDR